MINKTNFKNLLPVYVISVAIMILMGTVTSNGFYTVHADEAMTKYNNYTDISNLNINDTEVIKVKNTHSNKPEVSITIYYREVLNEFRLIYTCPVSLYDESDAVVEVRDTMIDLLKSKNKFHYERLKVDEFRYRKTHNGTSIVEITVYCKVYN